MGIAFEFQEGQTPIDESEREGLKISSISTQAELDQLEQLNIEKAIGWTIGRRLRAEKILTEAFLKMIHKRMFSEVWKWAGEFRRTDKNIGVPWYRVGTDVHQLCNDALYWVQNETYPPAEIALRFKHRLVSIHCFPNGNGRHSRIMADLLMECVFDLPVFSWRGSGLVKADEQRNAYIKALRAADGGNVQPLLEFAVGSG